MDWERASVTVIRLATAARAAVRLRSLVKDVLVMVRRPPFAPFRTSVERPEAAQITTASVTLT
jgi:hypothetical protein